MTVFELEQCIEEYGKEEMKNGIKMSGKISRSEAYDGCNALFTLPLDRAKADPEKAESYLRSLDQTPKELEFQP